jgi:hypothetical protein
MLVAGSISYSRRREEPCKFFASVAGCHDEYCWRDHHQNLDPALVGNVTPKDYMVPPQPGIACKNCFNNLREVSPSVRGYVMDAC